jgi:hypothetical protein
MMDGQPNFSLSIKNTSQVAPSNSKVWLSFNCFQITCLVLTKWQIARNGKQEQEQAMQSKTKSKAKQSKANKQKMQQEAERT